MGASRQINPAPAVRRHRRTNRRATTIEHAGPVRCHGWGRNPVPTYDLVPDVRFDNKTRWLPPHGGAETWSQHILCQWADTCWLPSGRHALHAVWRRYFDGFARRWSGNRSRYRRVRDRSGYIKWLRTRRSEERR